MLISTPVHYSMFDKEENGIWLPCFEMVCIVFKIYQKIEWKGPFRVSCTTALPLSKMQPMADKLQTWQEMPLFGAKVLALAQHRYCVLITSNSIKCSFTISNRDAYKFRVSITSLDDGKGALFRNGRFKGKYISL